MADSVDRVFSHALNTVNKIRTGSEKPPSTIRLKLYGLYKQAMEGDVEGIMERPSGNTEEEKRAREKWYDLLRPYPISPSSSHDRGWEIMASGRDTDNGDTTGTRGALRTASPAPKRSDDTLPR
jgi:acyl-CoA-binding protein